MVKLADLPKECQPLVSVLMDIAFNADLTMFDMVGLAREVLHQYDPDLMPPPAPTVPDGEMNYADPDSVIDKLLPSRKKETA